MTDANAMGSGARPLKKLGNLQRRRVLNAGEGLVAFGELPGGGALPGLFAAQKVGVGAAAWIGENRERVQKELAMRGGLLLRGFHVDEAGGLAAVARACATNTVMDYSERSSPRKLISSGVYTSTEYPASHPIFFHNENAYAHVWPARLCFSCITAATSGGATPLADTRRVLQRIDPAVRKRFEDVGILYVRSFGGPLGLHWKNVFQVNSARQLEDKCRETGYDFEWLDEQRLRTRRVGQAVVAHPETGDLSWFNHAAFFHRTTLAESIGDALAVVSDDELPSNTFYGDGAPIEPEVASAIRDAYRAEAVRFTWQPGDILLVDNLVTAHARDAYSGRRELHVAMLDPMTAGAGPTDLGNALANST